MKFSFILVVLTFTMVPNSGIANKPIEFDKKAFIEVQRSQVRVSDLAQELGEESDSEVQQMAYGQVGFDINLWGHSIDSNIFFRQTQSYLIENKSNVTNYSLYPKRTIARDLFKMEHINETGEDRSELVLNEFSYDWGDDEVWFTFGRMHIVYGEGVFSNPINPFNYSSGFANTYGINLANDGMEFLIGKKDDLKLHIYLLADRSFNNYEDEKVARTIFLRGEWAVNPATNINYVLGEDQKRHKYGVEVSRKITEQRKGYLQLVRYSQRLDKEEVYAKGLTHFLLGYQLEPNTRQAFTIEFGKQQRNTLDQSYDPINHLPFEGFAAISSRLSHSDKWSSELGFTQDTDSDYRFYKVSTTYDLGKFNNIRLFHTGPLTTSTSEDLDYTSQRYIPTETGIAARAHF